MSESERMKDIDFVMDNLRAGKKIFNVALEYYTRGEDGTPKLEHEFFDTTSGERDPTPQFVREEIIRSAAAEGCKYKRIMVNFYGQNISELYAEFSAVASKNFVEPRNNVYSPENLSEFSFTKPITKQDEMKFLHYSLFYRGPDDFVALAKPEMTNVSGVIDDMEVFDRAMDILAVRFYPRRRVIINNHPRLDKYIDQVQSDLFI